MLDLGVDCRDGAHTCYVCFSISSSLSGSRIAHKSPRSAKGELRLWDVRTGQRLYTLGGLKQQIMTHAFDPSGAFIAFAGGDGKILLHSISVGFQTPVCYFCLLTFPIIDWGTVVGPCNGRGCLRHFLAKRRQSHGRYGWSKPSYRGVHRVGLISRPVKRDPCRGKI
jgi:WD40 repeat protein